MRSGPLCEDDETWGMSHLLEHMVFRGTRKHRSTRAVSLAADDFGGEIGGTTYSDRVVYDTRVDAGSEGAALGLLSEMVAAPRFEGLEIEKDVLREELLEVFNDDGERASFTGTRLEEFVQAGGDATNEITDLEAAKAAGLNCVLLIQVPLKQKPHKRGMAPPMMGGVPGAFPAPAAARTHVSSSPRCNNTANRKAGRKSAGSPLTITIGLVACMTNCQPKPCGIPTRWQWTRNEWLLSS